MALYQLQDGNIIIAEADFIASNYPNATLLPDPVVVQPKDPISGVTFLRRFTVEQRIAIRTLAKTDSVAEDFMALLDATISQGTPIDLEDHDTVAGVNYLAATLPDKNIDPAIILE